MASIVLKDIPEELHHRLREAAAQNRRSMDQEAIYILEGALGPPPPLEPIKPMTTRRPFTQAWLRRALREGRE